MIHNPGDVRGRWPRRLWCSHEHSVDRKFYWTCFDCHAIRFKQDAIDEHNAMMAKLEQDFYCATREASQQRE